MWDYDLAAQPTLVDLQHDGEVVPAVLQGTKTGLIFSFNRETGEPIFDVEERPVPQGGVAGEHLSPTQPFPVAPPPLSRHSPVTADDAWGMLFFDERSCRRRMEGMRSEGIFTPPSLEGTILLPGYAGGINWGGVAVDPNRQVIVARSSNVPFLVRLIKRDEFKGRQGFEFSIELATQRGTPYAMARQPLLSSWGLPCNKPPWGTVTAIDINSGKQLWQVPHGTVRDVSPVPIPWKIGVPGVGAPLITSSGLVFLGGAWENVLRAFDLSTGEELWQGRLPAGPQATPMSFQVKLDDGDYKQLVVIAAGGHSSMGSDLGDYLIAFALPD